MAHTVSDVARLSGISVRTLHHYDEIGLLKPAHVGANGYRYYERTELLRLQQILFYRDVGFSLAEIAAIVDDPSFDPIAALGDHRRRLVGEIDRHHALIRTIDNTIAELCGDKTMADTNPYEGFSPEKQRAYEDELVARYGEEMHHHIAESHRRAANLTKAEHDAVRQEGHAINLALVERIGAGDATDAEAVQALVERHYRWVCNYWTPDAAAYEGLGQLYVTHADFRAFYDRYDDRLVDFLAGAMAVHAATRLARPV